jgi:hypothetical protein
MPIFSVSQWVSEGSNNAGLWTLMTIFQSLKDAFLPLLLLLLPHVSLLGHGRHHPKRIFTGKAHHLLSRAQIFKLLCSPRIDSKEPIPPGCVACVCNLSPTMGAWNQVGIGGIGLLYRPACLCIAFLLNSRRGSWNRFLAHSGTSVFYSDGPVWQPCSYSVPSLHRLLNNSITGEILFKVTVQKELLAQFLCFVCLRILVKSSGFNLNSLEFYSLLSMPFNGIKPNHDISPSSKLVTANHCLRNPPNPA